MIWESFVQESIVREPQKGEQDPKEKDVGDKFPANVI